MMPAAARHSKPKKPASKLGISIVAAAALASVVAALVYLNGFSGASQAADRPLNALTTGTSHAATAGMTGDQLTVDFRQAIAQRMARAATQARHRYLAAQAARRARLAAQRRARQAAQQAKQQAKQQATAQPSSSPAPTLSGGSDPAHSALGVCIRNAEEGGSYAWGPGNGGGAYQFALGTWEHYGGSAGEFGVAGPAYQDQIFDNAINAGGASNWTAYDGC
jgi:hypothetical protein